jgi:hypothetical protein
MRDTITRYGINGIVFTVLGPLLFWILYPVGAVMAWAITESSCHLLRYLSFRHLVFPRSRGYTVSPLRYIAAAAPTALIGFTVVALLKTALERNALVALTTATTMVAGYLINQICYQRR